MCVHLPDEATEEFIHHVIYVRVGARFGGSKESQKQVPPLSIYITTPCAPSAGMEDETGICRVNKGQFSR